MAEPILVTRPFLPKKEDYLSLVEQIMDRNWLTNDGPMVKLFEDKLASMHGSNNLIYTSNGTVAIQLAIKALQLKGEIITTPFSYVATTSSIVWENCKPVFADIDPETFNIDPAKVEALITPNTTAVLATHVFGNPCDIEGFELLREKYGIKIIYDAAHAFGVKINNRSLFGFGDISTTSFHATKVFHTIEGGAVFCNDDEMLHRLKMLRNFGHNGFFKFDGVGINGKNSEVHAAMGLAIIPYLEDILAKRKNLFTQYYNGLKDCEVQFQKLADNIHYNYSYFPVLFASEIVLDKVVAALENQEIFARRYFYPVLSKLDYVDYYPAPVAEDIAKRILCLPLYYDLHSEDVNRVVEVIKSVIK